MAAVNHGFRRHVIGFVVVVCVCLSGCTTPSSVQRRHGEPDMTYEEAGDMGRWYLGSDPGEHAWRWQLKELHYEQIQAVYVFTDDGFSHTREMNEQDFEELERLRNINASE